MFTRHSKAFALVACGTLGAFAPAHIARAAIVNISATRTVWANSPPQTSTSFGPYSRSASGMETGAGNFIATGRISQNSNIGDGETQPFVSYACSAQWTSSGGPSHYYLHLESTFSYVFELTSPGVFEHTFAPLPSGFPLCTLTPAGGSAINLLAAGMNDLNLSPGSYTLSIDSSHTVYAGGTSGNFVFSGTVSLVPAPHTAIVMVTLLLASRRRSRTADA